MKDENNVYGAGGGVDGNEELNNGENDFSGRANGAETEYSRYENYRQSPQDYKQGYTLGSRKTPKKNSGAVRIVVTCMVCSLICGSLGGYTVSKYTAADSSSDAYGTELAYQSVIRNVSAADEVDEELSVSAVSELVADSVVEIRTETLATSMWMTQYVTEGAGSGVIITADGYIITNNHVIEDASKITVTLHNGESYEAVLAATDEQTDIAVIKIEAADLSPAVFGTSADLAVGEQIVVIGNPLGSLGGSVSTGIISALDREITIDGQSMDLMQTDAAINPGNSGGGMFNMYGELVGIVNAKGSGSDIDNIGFAIPIDNVKNVVEQLISVGYVQGRAYLGINMLDILNERTAAGYRVSDLGVYIYEIDDTTNAYKAGLRAGDLIVAVNGTETASSTDVNNITATLTPGENITVRIKRSGSEKDYTFVLQEYVPN